jgi:magnesium chelatase family protein
MFVTVLSAATIGLEGVLIRVEVDVATRGFPKFNIVGLPSQSVSEAKERVRAAIVNSGFEIPDTRVTINLAPADIPKAGSGFDLPIALGILAASGAVDKETLKNNLFVGELSLVGDLRPVPGIISIAHLTRQKNIDGLFIPVASVSEAMLVEKIDIYPVSKIIDLILHLNGQKQISSCPLIEFKNQTAVPKSKFLFEDIKGQEAAKRAIEIAAAGFHNIHLKGPPGTGKTMLSRALPSILPEMEREELIEVIKIYSACGLLKNSPFSSARPFRGPHHTISRIGLVGGGSHPTPGEISLAHRGVLFLDEFTEFSHATLEALRQPMEDGEITISRAQGSLNFPCRFILLAASNPCPCGFLGHPKKSCHCLPGAIFKYKKRLSGPLTDRIDINIDVAPVEQEKLMTDSPSESSAVIKARVMRAYSKQNQRFKNSGIYVNGEMSPADIKKQCLMTTEAASLLKQAIDRLSLSARSYFKTIKIGQTIADLGGRDKIEVSHIAEALQFRNTDA